MPVAEFAEVILVETPRGQNRSGLGGRRFLLIRVLGRQVVELGDGGKDRRGGR